MRLKASLFSDADKANQQDIPVDLSHYPTVLPAAQESDDTLVQSTYNFISALQSAISCKDVSPISTFLNKNVQWSSPVVKSGKDLLQEQLPGFLSFFYDPKLQVFAIESVSPSERKVKVRYQLSFWYPFPWRPRIIVPATATISFETDQRTILSVDEAWDITLFDILLKQIPPRFWDIWHVFSIPVPEYPPVTNIVPLKPLQKEAISVVRLPESILYQAVWYAPKSLFGPPLTVIPGFSLYGRIGPAQGKGAEPYYTVKNVEVSSSRFLHPITGEEMKLYRWRMHVPTCLQDKVLSLVQSRTKLLIEGDSLLGDDDGNEISIASSAMDNTSSINVTDFEVENGYEPGSPLEDQVRMEPSVGPLLQHQQESGNDQQESDAEEGKDIRGTQYALTEKQMEIYEANQHTFGSFIYQRPRLMAQILLKGEVDSNRIAQTWKRLRESIEAGEIRDPQTGRPFRAKAIPVRSTSLFKLLILFKNNCLIVYSNAPMT